MFNDTRPFFVAIRGKGRAYSDLEVSLVCERP